MHIFTGRNEVLAKVIFSQACVILFTGGGGFLQIFGGVSNFSGGEVSPNFRGEGFLQIFGGGGVSTGIRSTFGRYASYWNAFLYLCFSADGLDGNGQKLHIGLAVGLAFLGIVAIFSFILCYLV